MQKYILFTTFLLTTLFTSACAPNAEQQEAGLNKRCNKKAENLAEYSECRCRGLTGSKSYDEKMDACMVDKERSTAGYTGPDKKE